LHFKNISELAIWLQPSGKKAIFETVQMFNVYKVNTLKRSLEKRANSLLTSV